MTLQLNKISFILFNLTVAIILFSCDKFQTGQRLYNSGLDHLKSADHGDYHDHEGLNKAILDFEKSIEKGFQGRDVFEKLSRSYILLNGDYQNAERVYTLGLQTFPNDIAFYFKRGICRKELRQHKLAFDDFNHVIILDTTRKYEYLNDAFYERGAMRYILGDTVNANKDREFAKSITDHELRTYQDYCQLWK
jgi:tetratricopeptide (TPR) repeat protein